MADGVQERTEDRAEDQPTGDGQSGDGQSMGDRSGNGQTGDGRSGDGPPEDGRSEDGWGLPRAQASDGTVELFGRHVAHEGLAWIALGVGALLTRLVALGAAPLSPDEGRRAMEALTLYREWRVEYEAGPLLTNLMSLVFALFASGDGQARLPTALAGVLLVLAPLLLRPIVGLRASLGTSLVLLVAPPLVTLSRTVSPTILVVLFLFVTVACARRFADERGPRWLVGTLVAVGLGLASDPSFTVGLAGLLLAYAIAEGDVGLRAAWLPAACGAIRWAVLVALGVSILASTRLLMNPNGVQAGLIDPLWAWSADVSRGNGLQAPLLYLLEDGSTLLLALVGCTRYRVQPRLVRFLGVWFLVAITLASLMRQPDPRYLFQPTLPAALLGGLGVVWIAETLRAHGSPRAVSIGLAALVPLVTAAFLINGGVRQGTVPWASAGVVAVAGILLVGLLAINVLVRAEGRAALATVVLVLAGYGSIAGASRWLEARSGERGQLIEASSLTDEVRTVRREVLRWSRADVSAPIFVEASLRPILGWALREIPTVRYDAEASARPSARVLASPPERTDEESKTVRIVVGYATDWGALSIRPTSIWSWVTQRQSLVGVKPYAIVLVEPTRR